MERIRIYVANSSIHGFHYITESSRHWTERLFWMLMCCASAYYTWLYLLATWYSFQHNAVSFVMETDFLKWNTTFPSVSLCEQESPDKLYDAATELYGLERNMNVDFLIRDVVFFDGACYSCTSHCSGITGEGSSSNDMNCTVDFAHLAKMVRSSCSQLIDNCSWNGIAFDCCDNFLPLETENGLCFTINSMHTKKPRGSLPLLIANWKNGPGLLKFETHESIKMYIHSIEDVPYMNHPQQEKVLLNWGIIFTMKIEVTSIENDRNLPLVSVAQRSCRLPQENYLQVYDYYSYSTCMVDCRAQAQYLLCNCTSHYTPGNTQFKKCDVLGLACLTYHAEILRTLNDVDFEKYGLSCKCISSCNEPEYNVVSSDVEMNKDNNNGGETFGTKVTVTLDRLPTQRFKRNVVRTRLDLIVSVGGTIGLFLGGSILSIIELFYYLLLRLNNFKGIDNNATTVDDDLKLIDIAIDEDDSSLIKQTSPQLSNELLLPNLKKRKNK